MPARDTSICIAPHVLIHECVGKEEIEDMYVCVRVRVLCHQQIHFRFL